ncbi:hypothetical protein [Pseudenhygromyxa sp. WMMC2535]|uniref:hypothetical protein n=1 Tax=Pseudenhygromyxa sp. WMMC2535 TaxID=2712867 RepID=UPI001551F5CE|nr:hypothetical protein [Pseudenhygromyxa sp. WMMC2535]
MTRQGVAILCATSLFVGLFGAPALLRAAEPPAPTLVVFEALAEASPKRAGLRVDVDELGSDGASIATKIEEDAKVAFDAEGLKEPIDELDPVIVVAIERLDDPENPGYVVGFSIEQDDEIVAGSARQSDCKLCTRTELVELVQKVLDDLLELAAESQADRTPAGDGGAEAGAEAGGDGAEGDGGREGGEEVEAIGPLGFAGIGVGVIGLAGVGAGAGLLVKGIEEIPERPIDSRDYRPGGYAALAVGGAALVAGVVMIAIDVSKRKKARSRESARVRWDGLGVSF